MKALVRLDNVSCRYNGAPVLTGVDLALEPGTFVGVVGPSGSGKTTLLRAITGAIRPSSGTVTRSPGLRIGYVPQVETVNWYFPVTVREAVLMAREPMRRVPWASKEEIADAEAVLEQLGLGGLGKRHIRELSGGQQQRVFIARAMLRRAELLLMDEPTSGVDVRTRHDVVHLLHDLHHAGLAILVTTHDLNGIAAHLPTLVCLNHTVVARGAPSEVLTSDVLERTYGAPMSVLSHGGMPIVIDTIDDLPEEHHDHV